MNNLGLNPDPPNPEPLYKITGAKLPRNGYRYSTNDADPDQRLIPRPTYFLRLIVCCAPMPAERLGHGFRFIARHLWWLCFGSGCRRLCVRIKNTYPNSKTKMTHVQESKKKAEAVLRIRFRDPVPFWPLDPGWKKTGSGMNFPEHFSESLETVFRVKNIWIIWCGSGTGIRYLFDAGSAMEKLRSGIKIPDPQHWETHLNFFYCKL